MHSTAVADPVREYVGQREFRMLIGGDLREAENGETFETIDPSTGRVIASVPLATAADVDRAYRTAAGALEGWQALGVTGRIEILERYAQLLEEHEDLLAMVDAIDGGMPFEESRKDVRMAVANVRAWPGLVRWHGGRTIPASPGNLHYTTYRPYGVVAKILPFNHPILFAATRLLAALYAGNTAIVKPAPQTSLSALMLGELAREVFPAGVLNVISGGVEAGNAMVTHPQIKRIGFTGSVATGLKIQQAAATAGVKHVSLELGGKNPMIVFPDVDLDKAAAGAVKGMNFGICAGQSCGSNSRTYVHADIYDAFLERVTAQLEDVSLGIPYLTDADMGPLVTREHLDRVESYVASGVEEGARLLTGGAHPADPELADGYFLRPTLFADVEPQMRIAHEEIFGPVMAMAAWHDLDEVVRIANDTDLGLTASIWTNDLFDAHRTADRLNAGYVWINDSARHYWGTPFGGLNNSGLGREESIEEYESYLELKAVQTIIGGARA